MKSLVSIFLLLLSLNLYAGTWCRAYCLITTEPVFNNEILETAFEVNADSAERLVEKCRRIRGTDIPRYGANRILANSYKTYGPYYLKRLKSYVPATISNSCVDSADKPLME